MHLCPRASMELKGQYFGKVFDAQGALIGTCWLHIDPERTDGHVLYRPLDQPQRTAVAALGVSGAGDNALILSLRRDDALENCYRIAQEYRLPPPFNATVNLAPAAGQAHAEGDWKTADATGRLQLEQSYVGAATEAQDVFDDWESYKNWADKVTRQPGSAFRGQGNHHRLCTTFHRTGRVDMVRFIYRDLPHFVDYLETATRQPFNLQEPKDFGAALGMAQHYGFPTPLLDWTMSPYVAAYFAFADVIENKTPPPYVRIFRLASSFVSEGLQQPVMNTIDAGMSVVAYRPVSKGNDRLLNQQGLFTFSNVVDIEAYFRARERERQLNSGALLEVVDVAANQAKRALADLRNMGTTAATLFPGLDGVARHLKHLQFYAP